MHVTKVFTNHSFVTLECCHFWRMCLSRTTTTSLWVSSMASQRCDNACLRRRTSKKKRILEICAGTDRDRCVKQSVTTLCQGKFMYKISMRVWAPRGYVVRYSGKTVFGDIMTSQCEFTRCSHPLLFWKWKLTTTWQMTLDSRCRRPKFFVLMILCSALRAIWTRGISKPMSWWLCLWSHVKLKTWISKSLFFILSWRVLKIDCVKIVAT